MSLKIRIALISCLPLLYAGAALGGEGVQVKITNDGTEDIVVTVYDMNTRPQRVVLENARINGFASVPVTLVGDPAGRANLSWTATSLYRKSRQCGHYEAALGDDASLNVHVDAPCRV